MSSKDFWQLLCDGQDAIGPFPPGRMDIAEVFDGDRARPGRMYVSNGGFIEGVDQFDAAFFGISPREAAVIDPQHRLLLEVSYEALEDAGIALERIAGSPTGVFVGISTHDYGDIQMYPGNRAQIGSHSNSGTATSIAANRLSYLYDLRGPSMAVDTACSSALTATHLACESLARGECDLALVGGVHLVLTPEPTIGFCKANMLSPDERCHAFDAAANGYVRSEGVGVVILKPLAAALADGDAVYAVIRATAINQDGHTTGMTVPSREAQAAMLRRALDRAGVAPEDIDYVEAHGTGTPVGDPIEAGAIGAALGRFLSNRPACVIGSVKTNIGHLEAASGIAGLIKATLAVAHRQIPPSLHFKTPNPAIDFAGLGLRVATTLETWPQNDRPATAGVNSFGFGGANAHVILQEPPRRAVAAEPAAPEQAEPERAELLLLSARSEDALTATARAYFDLLDGEGDHALVDVCGSAALRRSQHAYRAAIVAASRAELVDALDGLVAGERRAEIATGCADREAGKIAFVFGGMGPQWWGMGRQLMRDEAIFRAVLEQCDALLRPIAGWSLLDALHADEASSRVAEANIAQVTNFAIQAALAALWRSWGIVPDAVIGHSAGGIAASHIAGVHDLADTLLLAYHRSRLQSRASGQGTMLAVGLGAVAAQEAIAACAGQVWLAAVNSPTSCALSGDADALERICVQLQEQGAFARLLQVAVPYHSARMDPIHDELLAALRPLKAGKAQIGLVSDVTGDWADGTGYDAGYWWRTVRQPVRFAEGVATLIDAGFDTFVELSPHPVLSNSVNECLAGKGKPGLALPSLRRHDDDRKVMLRSLAALAVRGHPVQWKAVQSGFRNYVKLPSYPWQHERHWFESQAQAPGGGPARRHTEGEHPLLGTRLHAATPLWEADFGGAVRGWLDDHIVQGAIVFPAAAYVEMAMAVAAAVAPGRVATVRDLDLSRALFLSQGREPLVQTVLDHDHRLTIHSAPDDAEGDWTLHASALIEWLDPPLPPAILPTEPRSGRELAHADFYQGLTERGLGYGGSFTGVARLWQDNGTALGEIDIAALGLSPEPYHIHPALLDAAFQVLIAAASDAADTPTRRRQLLVPVHIDSITLFRRPAGHAWSHARVVCREPELLIGEIDLHDDTGVVWATIRGLHCAPLSAPRRETGDRIADWLYEFRWEPGDRPVRARLSPDAAIAAASVQAGADALSAASGWQRYYTEVEPPIDRLAAQLAAEAVRDLGWDLEPGTLFRAEDLIDRLRIAPSTAALTRRLLLMLADIGVLAPETDATWRVVAPLPSPNLQALADQILAQHPAYATDLSLILRCGNALAGVLRGEADAREVLLGADGLAELSHFYRDAPASSYYGGLLADAFAKVTERAAGPLRIVEIGGGTGGVTEPLLASLPPHGEYLFTDISPLFVTRAAERFAEHAGFAAQTLDIEQDPVPQGCAASNADIVVAANVLHATADLRKTLAHVRRLLAPGGLLVLLEITRKPRWLDIVFGATDGWWKFRDHDLRPDHALLDPAQWTALLAAEGFASAHIIADTDHPGSPGQSVIVAQIEDRRAAGTWLVLSDNGDVGGRLRGELARRGGETVLVRPGDALEQIGPDEFAARLDDAGDLCDVLDALAGRELRGAVLLSALDADDCDAPLAAQRAVCSVPLAVLAALRQSRLPALWLVTAGATPAGEPASLAVAQAPLWGLARVMMREQAEVRCRLVDLDAPRSDAALAALADEITGDAGDEEVAFRSSARWVHRLARLDATPPPATRPPAPDEGWRIEAAVPGALATIAALAAPRRDPGPRQVEIAVAAAGLNFRDVMLAAGMIPSLATDQTFGEQGLGLDCAGHIVRCGSEVTDFAPGDEVIAIAPNALGAFVTTDAALVAHKPACLTFETGAALPCAFVTAHYALDQLARLGRGERALIHAATGGVGLAAIQIARRAGAEIFATAGTEEKRAYLRALGVRHVMDSRTLAFADQIHEATNGEGVDVVLNSLAGEAIPKGIGILRPYGRFVEIGKRDIYADSRIGLLPFRKNISFFAVDLDRLCNERPELAGGMLREIVAGFAAGEYSALPQQVFPASQAEGAVRLMAQARHIGKIVLQTADPELKIAALRAVIRPDGSYLITGGLGGFGLATAQWLVRHGARAIALMGRRAPGPEAQAAIQAMRAEQVRVEAFQGDVARIDDVKRVLAEVRAGGPLRGVVHCAMVLDDAPLAEMTPVRLRDALAPKTAGAWNLHLETAGDGLDLFVLYSSLVAVIGNPLQGNYAAANAFLDALAHHRRALGLPGLAVQWGVIADAGYVAQHPDVAEYLSRQGYESFGAGEALDALGDLIERNAAEAVVARIDWQKLTDYSPATSASSSFRRFTSALTTAAAPEARSGSAAAIARIDDPDQRLAAIEQYLRDKVGKVLGMNPQRVNADRPLTEIGLDSLIAVELVTTLKLELGFELPVVKLLQGLALSGLAAQIAKALPPAITAAQPTAGEPAPPAATTEAATVSAPALPAPPEESAAPAAVVSVGTAVAETAAPQYWTAAQQIVRWCARAGFSLGARIEVTGLEHIPRSGGFVLAANHLSFLDVPAVLSVMPRPVTLLAAEWLQANAAFRWVLGDIGRAIFVRRGEGDREALDAAVAMLRAGGIIGIGPEGGINRTGGLLAGRPGAAYLATTAGVCVIPVAVWGQERVAREWRRLRRPEIRVAIGAPLAFPQGVASAAELQRHTEQIMLAIAALLPSSYRGVYAEVTGKAA